MFTSEDFRVESGKELLEFLPIMIFVALIAPFLLIVYQIGFISDKIGWLD